MPGLHRPHRIPGTERPVRLPGRHKIQGGVVSRASGCPSSITAMQLCRMRGMKRSGSDGGGEGERRANGEPIFY